MVSAALLGKAAYTGDAFLGSLVCLPLSRKQASRYEFILLPTSLEYERKELKYTASPRPKCTIICLVTPF